MNIRVVLAQLNSTDNWRRNLETMSAMIAKASRSRAEAILFPENALFMGAPTKLRTVAVEMNGVISLLQENANRSRVAVLVGSYPEAIRGSRKVYNTSVWIDERGKILAKYRKIHLFDVVTPKGDRFSESRFVEAGDRLVTFRWKGVKIGMSVCYDVRFPEHYRALARLGAEWFLVPSAFTAETGRAHWHTLLRARAIENLAYVLAPAQTGRHSEGRRTFGHSLAISPWGKILVDPGVAPGSVTALLNRRDPSDIRGRFGRSRVGRKHAMGRRSGSVA